MRQRHGLAQTEPVGSATCEEIEAARQAMGHPEDHEAWLAAVANRREQAEQSPYDVFMAELHRAVDRLNAYDWSIPGNDDEARAADLQLDLSAAALDGDDPEALSRAMEALRRWEAAWARVGYRTTQQTKGAEHGA